MKRLILMRHAKSSWNDPATDDHDRPLNGRGRTSARLLGNWLKARQYSPDQTLCSDARRTRETLAGLEIRCDAQFLNRLYHAGPGDLLDVLRGAKGDCVLLLGHNPGIGQLARGLVDRPPAHPRFLAYPTGATLVADIDIAAWADLGPGTACPADFVTPRDLMG